MEQFVDAVPLVPLLDDPVPQMVEQLPDVMRFFDFLLNVPEQVVEVPKILLNDVPMRTAVRDTQLAEQLVEVPTIVSYSWLLLRMEQNVDTGLQGFLPGQSSTAPTVAQIVDIPVLKVLVLDRVRQRLSLFTLQLVRMMTRMSLVKVFFALFPKIKKVRSWLRTRGRNCSPSRAHPRRLLSWRSPSSGCGSGNATLARLTSGTDVPTVQSGRLQLVSKSCGTAKGMRREGSATGTGTRVSPRLTSLLFLLGEEWYRQPRAVYKCWRAAYVPDHAATSSSSFRRTCGWCLSSILRHSGFSCRSSAETGHDAVAGSLGPFAIEIHQLQFIDQVFDVLVAQVQQIRSKSWETVEIPQLQLVFSCTGCCSPVVCNNKSPWSMTRCSSSML